MQFDETIFIQCTLVALRAWDKLEEKGNWSVIYKDYAKPSKAEKLLLISYIE